MARAWTIEELNREYPLPNVPTSQRFRWTWEIWSGQPVAVSEGGMRWVAIDPDGNLFGAVDIPRTPGAWASRDCFNPPADVALVVIEATKGMDSREAVVEAIAGRAAQENERCLSDEPGSAEWHYANGVQRGLNEAAAMLRRGTVNA